MDLSSSPGSKVWAALASFPGAGCAWQRPAGVSFTFLCYQEPLLTYTCYKPENQGFLGRGFLWLLGHGKREFSQSQGNVVMYVYTHTVKKK